MSKREMDVCDVCDQVVTKTKGGIEISGENIAVSWVGKDSPEGDPFKNSGVHIPMNGRVTLTICKVCLVKELGLIPGPRV